jgi:hypothetical protein
MHTNTATVLAIFAIVMAIALVTSSSLVASAIAVKKHKSGTSSSTTRGTRSSTTRGTSSSTTGVSKLISCIRALPSTFTRADVDNCYDTVFTTGGSTASSASGSSLGTP